MNRRGRRDNPCHESAFKEGGQPINPHKFWQVVRGNLHLTVALLISNEVRAWQNFGFQTHPEPLLQIPSAAAVRPANLNKDCTLFSMIENSENTMETYSPPPYFCAKAKDCRYRKASSPNSLVFGPLLRVWRSRHRHNVWKGRGLLPPCELMIWVGS